jgi:outer membrane receptor for ferrienterochelin and colicins
MGNNDEILESIIDDYHHLDFNLTRDFKQEKIFWTIGAKNLFDVQSVNTTSSSGVHSTNVNSKPVNWGRSFFTSLKFKLN